MLIDVDPNAYNNADYAVVAASSLGKARVLIEIDNNQHAGGGQYSPELERQKNTSNLACGKDFDRVLLLRISPCGRYRMAVGEEGNADKKARLLIARDWIACFLRAPPALVDGVSGIVQLLQTCRCQMQPRRSRRSRPRHSSRDCQAQEHVASDGQAATTRSPGARPPRACTLDPYLAIKGSALAQQHLAQAGWHSRPVRS